MANIVVLTIGLLCVPISEQGARFSDETQRLLIEISQGYALDDQRVPSGSFDKAVLDAAARSRNKTLRSIAEHLPELDLISSLNKKERRSTPDHYTDMLETVLGRLVDYTLAQNDAAREESVRQSIEILEKDFVDTSRDVDMAWATACIGSELANSLKTELRSLAREARPNERQDKGLVSVAVGSGRRAGTVNVTNTSGKTLTNCLIITRLEPDTRRLKKLAQEEETFGRFILPALGFSKAVTKSSTKASSIRYSFYLQEKGVVAFVPEVPSGATVTTTLANPAYFRISKAADISIWCDQGSAEEVAAENWRP